MSYTNIQVKDKFWTTVDDYYTGYLDDTRLTYVAQTAVANIIESKLDQEGYSDDVDWDLTPLKVKFDGASGSIDLDSLEYKKFSSLQVSYANGPRPATPVKSVEVGSVYSEGTARYPKYLTYSNSGTNTMSITPTSGITATELWYYKKPLVSDGTDIDFTVGTYDLKYSIKLVELIIAEMAKLFGQIIREQELVNSSLQNEQMNP